MVVPGSPWRLFLWRGGVGVALAAPVVTVVAYALMRTPARPPAVLQAAPAALALPAPAPAPRTAPTFDVVRVGPGGNAVIAGRAEPGAQVVVRESGQLIGEAKADSRGEWVLLPAAPLAPGGRELTLASRLPGATETQGDSVLLAVPGPSTAAASAAPAAVPAAVLLLPRTGAPRILGMPDPASRAAGTALGLGTVDYDDRGDIRFAGTARPGAPVRVYVDNLPAGEAVADPLGHWSLSPPSAVAAGLHRLRVDQVTTGGRVQARVEVPFQRTSLPTAELASGRVVVQPGQTLWRLARTAYGTGVRYTVIYLANREQIRDPRLIYPGQAFALPDTPRQP